MIEWRWGLEPLTVRDQTANNLAEALDFTQARNHVPLFSVPAGPFGAPCPAAAAPSSPDGAELGGLAGLAATYGLADRRRLGAVRRHAAPAGRRAVAELRFARGQSARHLFTGARRPRLGLVREVPYDTNCVGAVRWAQAH